MKRNARYMCMVVAAAMAGGTLAGCDKELTGNLNMEAESHQGAGKTSVDGAAVYWVSGDRVNINGTEYTVSATGSSATIQVTAEENATLLACYPADIMSTMSASSLTVTLPGVYTYAEADGRQAVAFPLAAVGTMEENGTLKFKHLCAAMEVEVKNTSSNPLMMNSITVSSQTAKLSGEATINISGINSAFSVTSNTASTEAQKRVMLTFGETEVTIAAGASRKFQIPMLPVGSGDKLTFTISTSESSIAGVTATSVHIYSRTVDTKADIARAVVAQTPALEIASGAANVTTYSTQITADGSTAVYFSQGDLEYNTTSSAWQFGTETKAYTAFNKGTVYDLFRWGNIASSYTPMGTVGASSTGTLGDNDWGKLAISNGGNTAKSGWRTPTLADWNAILNSRTTGITINSRGNCHFLQCRIGTAKGLVIFPDNFASVKPADVDYTYWEGNSLDTRRTNDELSVVYPTISEADWAKLRRVGCVFLVEDGYYSGTEIKTDGGAYWSATLKMDSPNIYSAYILYFNGAGVSLESWRSGAAIKPRENGCTVRLVRNV